MRQLSVWGRLATVGNLRAGVNRRKLGFGILNTQIGPMADSELAIFAGKLGNDLKKTERPCSSCTAMA